MRATIIVPATALFLGGIALELSSEKMTMTTSYPSPTGIYRNLTTTQKTLLARDGGNEGIVGIGTSSPNPNARLDVRGPLLVSRPDGAFPNPALPVQTASPGANHGIENVWGSDYLSLLLRDRSGNSSGDDKDALILWGDNADDQLRFVHRRVGGMEREIMRMTSEGPVGVEMQSGFLVGRPQAGAPPFPVIQEDRRIGDFNHGMEIFWDNDYAGLLLRDRDNNTATRDDKDGVLLWGDNTDDSLRFVNSVFTGSAIEQREAMRVINGNVGVGTTSPRSRLHVAGNYIQIPVFSNNVYPNKPPAADCPSGAAGLPYEGRMVVRTWPLPVTLFVCAGGNWHPI